MLARAVYQSLVRPLLPALNWVLPADAFWSAAHLAARKRFHSYVKARVTPHWFREVNSGPYPSEEIQRVTNAFDASSIEKWPSAKYFFDSYKQMTFFLQVLERFSFNLRTTGAILELGCGSARLLRLLTCLDGLRLVGTDVNPVCITWCQKNVPGPEYYVNELRPPLAFAEDASFDLVYAYSVFNHIPLEWQPMWLNEIRRILRPGGFLLSTVLGSNYRQRMLSAEERNSLLKVGHVTLDASNPNAALSTRLTGSWDLFQTRSHIVRSFGSVLCLRDFIPALESPIGQDLLVLQRDC